jgi:hypothetical protein
VAERSRLQAALVEPVPVDRRSVLHRRAVRVGDVWGAKLVRAGAMLPGMDMSMVHAS